MRAVSVNQNSKVVGRKTKTRLKNAIKLHTAVNCSQVGLSYPLHTQPFEPLLTQTLY